MPLRLKLAATIVASVLVVCAVGATLASAAKVAPRRIGASPELPAGTTATGALPGSTQLSVDVTLNPSDAAALSRYATAVSTPGTAEFHNYLTVAQFRQRFAPSNAQIAGVESSLRAAGLTPDPVSANGLSIKVSATASQLESAFDTTIDRIQLPSGRIAFTNTTAPEVSGAGASAVQAVLGLNNLVTEVPGALRPQVTSRVAAPAPARASAAAATQSEVRTGADTGQTETANATSAPVSCANASNVSGAYDTSGYESADVSAYTPSQLGSIYGLSSLWGQGDYGAGQTVGLVEFEQYSPTDISTYESCFFPGQSPSLTTYQVDGSPGGSATGSGESELDIEEILSLAPAANIDVYEAPNGDQYDLLSAMVQNTAINVISDSWASCELAANSDTGTASVSAVNTLLEESAIEGQSFFASSGDDGSTACYPNDTTNGAGSTPDVNFPASSPWVTGVGGTELVASGATGSAASQTVWNESPRGAGATGGGVSSDFTMPAYQSGATGLNVISSSSSKTACNGGASYCRQVPDVSALADPETGYVIYYTGSEPAEPTANGWQVIGGTSAAAPLWGAIAALANASSYCSADPVGFANPLLYSLASRPATYASDFTDITTATGGDPANNDYSPSGYTGGLYPVGTGYDMSTGLGSPVVANLVPDLCTLAATPSSVIVTTGSPAIAADGTSTTQVTVTVANASGDGVRGELAHLSLSSTGNQTISALTDNGNGTYTATLTGTTTQGVSTITATYTNSATTLTGSTQLTQADLEIQELRFANEQVRSGTNYFLPQDGYVELYNESAVPVPLSGWSLDYAESSNNTPDGTQLVSLSSATVPPYGHVLVGDYYYNSDLGPTSDGGDGGPAADVSFISNADPVGVALNSPSDSRSLDAVGFTADSFKATSAAPVGFYSGTPISSPENYYSGETAWTRKFSGGSPVNTQINANDFVMVDTSSVVTTPTYAPSYGNPTYGAPDPQSTLSPVNENAFLQSALVSPSAGATASPNAIITGSTLDINRTIVNCSGITSSTLGNYPASCANAAMNTAAVTVTAVQFRVTGLTTSVVQAENSTANTVAGVSLNPLTLQAPAGSTAGLNAVWSGANSSGTSDITGGLAPGASVNVDFRFSIVASGHYSFAYNTEDDLVPYTGPLPAGPTPDPGTTDTASTDTTPTAPTSTTDPAAGPGSPVASAGTDAGSTVVTGTITPAQAAGVAPTTSSTPPKPVTAVTHAWLTRLSLIRRAGHLMLQLAGLSRGAISPGATLTIRSRVLAHALTVRVSARGTFTVLARARGSLTAGRYPVTVTRAATVLARGYVVVASLR